jgi:MFS family permease
MSPPAPPAAVTWRSHLSLALLGLVYIFSYIDRQAIAVLVEPIKREFGVSDTAMGLLTGLAFGLLYAGLGVPIGRLADRANRRNIVAVCCTLWSMATMACGVAVQFWHLLVARMAVSIGEAGGMAPSISLVSDLYPKRHRSLAISLFMMGPHFGVLIGLGLGGWIAQHYGWRSAFLWLGAPGVILGPLVWLLVREPPRGGFETPPTASAPASALSPARESMWDGLWRLLSIPAFRWLCLGCGIAGISGYGYGVWVPSFLVRTHELTIAHAGLVFGVASGVGAVAGALVSGWLCDRLVTRDVRWQIGLPIIGVLLAIPAALALFLWPAGGHWMLGSVKVPHPIGFALLFGFFASWWPSLSYSAVSQMVPAHERATAAAVLNLFVTLFGVGAGPLVTGMISDVLTPLYGVQALRYALVAVVSLMALTAGLYAFALEPYRRRLQALTP